MRIISPDRPALGLSDPKIGSTLLDWADDTKQLELNKLDQCFIRPSEHVPKATEAILASMGKLAEHAPQTWNTIMLRLNKVANRNDSNG